MTPGQFLGLTDRVPFLKRWAWQRWYQYLAGYDVAAWSFMNYGYEWLHDTPGAELALDAADTDDRYCIQLYHHVAGSIDLQGLDVLEVGSGRGGGASFMQRYLHPKTVTGVDYSAKAVELCTQRHQVEGLSFRQGDAESLPFDAETFDAVVNVESSHCYGSMPAFLGEVTRVLRPGGHFLYADFRSREDAEVLARQIAGSELTMLEEETITPNVVRALDADSERKQALIRGHIRRWLARTFQQFAGIRGTAIYRCFQDGTFVYKRYRLQK